MKGIWRSNHYGDYAVFRGEDMRVAIHMCDLRELAKQLAGMQDTCGVIVTPLSFDVQVLQGSRSMHTPYRAGREVYWGYSARQALCAVRRYVRVEDDEIPRKFRTYLSDEGAGA